VPKSLPEDLESKPGLMNVKELSEILGLHPETASARARNNPGLLAKSDPPLAPSGGFHGFLSVAEGVLRAGNWKR
jgi:hypothetical protein